MHNGVEETQGEPRESHQIYFFERFEKKRKVFSKLCYGSQNTVTNTELEWAFESVKIGYRCYKSSSLSPSFYLSHLSLLTHCHRLGGYPPQGNWLVRKLPLTVDNHRLSIFTLTELDTISRNPLLQAMVSSFPSKVITDCNPESVVYGFDIANWSNLL